MASLYTKFLDFIGIEESDEQEDERRDDGYYRDEPSERPAGGFGAGRAAAAPSRRNDRMQNTSGANLPISGGMKMIVYHPVSYEDTQSIIDNLKNRKPVIVNMEELELDTAQRILDFLSGAVYAASKAGLVGLALFLADTGILGGGTFERISVYTIIGWEIVTGATILVKRRLSEVG